MHAREGDIERREDARHGGNDGRKDGQGAGRRDVAGGCGLQGLRNCGAGRSRGGRGEARRREQRRAHQSGFRQLLKLDLQKDRRCIGDAHGTCYSGILALAGDRIVRGRANKAEAQKPDGARNVDGNRLLCDADLDGARRG